MPWWRRLLAGGLAAFLAVAMTLAGYFALANFPTKPPQPTAQASRSNAPTMTYEVSGIGRAAISYLDGDVARVLTDARLPWRLTVSTNQTGRLIAVSPRGSELRCRVERDGRKVVDQTGDGEVSCVA
jgi:hypothetical protein